MKTSPRGVAAIALFEGVVTRAYKDSGGVWTIGVGHTNRSGRPPKVISGMTITRQQALDILSADLPQYERDVMARMGDVAQTVFDGAVSFHFNTGAIKRAGWVGDYLKGDFAAAETRLKNTYITAGGRHLQGLVNRRAAEANLIFHRIYPDGTTGASAPVDRESVVAYQGQLAALGYGVGPVDGIRGEKTIAAVKAFQVDHDLVVDGIVGPATRATLDRAIKDSKQPVVPPAPPIQPPPPDDPGPSPQVDPERPPVTPAEPRGCNFFARAWARLKANAR